MSEPAPVDRDGNELHIEDQVRRGRGTTTWRITSIDDLIGLESITQTWTHSSINRSKAHTLTRLPSSQPQEAEQERAS